MTSHTPALAEQMRARAKEATQLLKILANDKRLMILCLLSERELSVGELNTLVALSQSALSQHLAVLRAEGVVNTRREAQTIYYSLLPGPALEMMRTLYAIYCAPLQKARMTP
ncbi:MAG TPA: metalloregulator ArsR/SmtB family transcription factor [Xylella taiwanensis]